MKITDIPFIIEEGLDIIDADLKRLKALKRRDLYQSQFVLRAVEAMARVHIQFKTLEQDARNEARNLPIEQIKSRIASITKDIKVN
jgi:hypothetical protein